MKPRSFYLAAPHVVASRSITHRTSGGRPQVAARALSVPPDHAEPRKAGAELSPAPADTRTISPQGYSLTSPSNASSAWEDQLRYSEKEAAVVRAVRIEGRRRDPRARWATSTAIGSVLSQRKDMACEGSNCPDVTVHHASEGWYPQPHHLSPEQLWCEHTQPSRTAPPHPRPGAFYSRELTGSMALCAGCVSARRPRAMRRASRPWLRSFTRQSSPTGLSKGPWPSSSQTSSREWFVGGVTAARPMIARS